LYFVFYRYPGDCWFEEAPRNTSVRWRWYPPFYKRGQPNMPTVDTLGGRTFTNKGMFAATFFFLIIVAVEVNQCVPL
jgi:hypothetical protein